MSYETDPQSPPESESEKPLTTQQRFVRTIHQFANKTGVTEGAWSVFASRAAGEETGGVESPASGVPEPTFDQILSKSKKWEAAYWNGRNLGDPAVKSLRSGLEQRASEHSQNVSSALKRWGSDDRKDMEMPNWLLNNAFGKRHYRTVQIYQGSWYGGVNGALINPSDRSIEEGPRQLLSLLVIANQARYELQDQIKEIQKSYTGVTNAAVLEEGWDPAFYRLGLYETINETLYNCVEELGGFDRDSAQVEYDDGHVLGLFFTVNMLRALEFIRFQGTAKHSKDEGILRTPFTTKEYTQEKNDLYSAIALVLLNAGANAHNTDRSPINFLAIRDLLKQFVGRYPGTLDIKYWSSIDLSPFDAEFLDHVPSYTGFRPSENEEFSRAVDNFYHFSKDVQREISQGGSDSVPRYRLGSGGYVEIPELHLLTSGRFDADFHIYNPRGRVVNTDLNLEVIAHIPNYSQRGFIGDELFYEEVGMEISVEKLAPLLMDGRVLVY